MCWGALLWLSGEDLCLRVVAWGQAYVCAALPFGVRLLRTRKEVEDLDVDGVVKFAQEQGLNGAALQVLKDQEIDGSVLQDMTVNDLERYGMKGGPTKKLMKALDKVFGRGE